jgi:hypothetical protein
MGGEKFGFFYQPDYEKKKKIEEKEATAYRWSALADGGGPAPLHGHVLHEIYKSHVLLSVEYIISRAALKWNRINLSFTCKKNTNKNMTSFTNQILGLCPLSKFLQPLLPWRSRLYVAINI